MQLVKGEQCYFLPTLFAFPSATVMFGTVCLGLYCLID